MIDPFRVVAIFVSPGHNFFGRYGKPPGDHDAVEVASVECVAGKGLRGDRFFDFKPGRFPDGYDGQVTFFALETFHKIRDDLGVFDRDVSVFRRNIITEGSDLRSLLGREFTVQGVRFFAGKEATPCEWMNTAFAPGALKALAGRGGIRAKILTSGTLRAEPATKN
jgi:MOSC domain-containing protein YiiM